MEEERKNTNDREYANKEITVYWEPSKCIHVTTCYRELIEVFNPRKRPWIDMDGAPTEEIIRVVNMCPTQALRYKWNHEMKNKEFEKKSEQDSNGTNTVEIRVVKDGPILVKGDFIVTGSDGQTIRKQKMMSFCRCGQSKNMPFCDGHHRKVAFRAD